MIIKGLLFFAMLGGSTVYAQGPVVKPEVQTKTYTIKQIVALTSSVVVETNSEEMHPAGQIFLVTFDDGKQCALILKQDSQGLLILDSSKCDREKYLTLGLSIEPTMEKAQGALKQTTTSPFVEPSMSERSITDLGYLAAPGNFFVKVSSQFSTQKTSIYSGSLLATNVQSRSSSASTEIGYGLMDGFELSAELSYLLNQSNEYEATSAEYISNGAQEPKLSIRYRLLSETENSPLDLVARFFYSPKMGSNELATQNNNGNGYRGHSSTGFEIALYKRTPKVQMGLNIAAIQNGKGESKSASDGSKYEDGEDSIVSVSAQAQFSVNSALALRTGLGLVSYSSSSRLSVDDGEVSKTSSYSATAVMGGARIVLVPQKAFIDLDLTLLSLSDTTYTEGSTTLKAKEQSGAQFLAGFRYEI